MWELVTRLMPFGDIEPFSVPIKVTKGERPIIPKECPKEYTRLINRAWHQKANKRPSFEDLERFLRRLKNDMQAERKRIYGKFKEEPTTTNFEEPDPEPEPESVSDSHSHSQSQSQCTTSTTTTTELNEEDDSDKSTYAVSSGGNSEKNSGNGSNVSVSNMERRKSRKSSHGKITVRKRQ